MANPRLSIDIRPFLLAFGAICFVPLLSP